jgi:hypothetical protein
MLSQTGFRRLFRLPEFFPESLLRSAPGKQLYSHITFPFFLSALVYGQYILSHKACFLQDLQYRKIQ